MPRPSLEVADIFRSHGAAWRKANAGHVSLGQLKAMAAIEACRTAELGGHVAACEDCGHTVISYNSCGNRHCPKCHVWTVPAVQEESDIFCDVIGCGHVFDLLLQPQWLLAMM